jgi:hypothetical protein
MTSIMTTLNHPLSLRMTTWADTMTVTSFV